MLNVINPRLGEYNSCTKLSKFCLTESSTAPRLAFQFCASPKPTPLERIKKYKFCDKMLFEKSFFIFKHTLCTHCVCLSGHLLQLPLYPFPLFNLSPLIYFDLSIYSSILLSTSIPFSPSICLFYLLRVFPIINRLYDKLSARYFSHCFR